MSKLSLMGRGVVLVCVALAGCDDGGGDGAALDTGMTTDGGLMDGTAGAGGVGGGGGAGAGGGAGGAGGVGGAGAEGGAGGLGGAGGEGGEGGEGGVGGAGGEGGEGGVGGAGGEGGMGGEGGAGGAGGAGGEGGGQTPGAEGDLCGVGRLECGAGLYCFLEASCVAGDAGGRCAPLPEACRDIDAPVCGCDGTTYDSACQAASAGVNVAQEGPCRAVVEVCDAQNPCDDGKFCDFGPQCGDGGQQGLCVELPEVCRAVDAPVCGCDGNTWGNACLAGQAGVSVVSDAACRQGTVRRCGGAADLACEGGAYCDFGASCGNDGQRGACEATPENCRQQDAPVCGCDGTTYGNPCLAAQAGVSVLRDGPCRAR